MIFVFILDKTILLSIKRNFSKPVEYIDHEMGFIVVPVERSTVASFVLS
jgi:hypothetical protein